MLSGRRCSPPLQTKYIAYSENKGRLCCGALQNNSFRENSATLTTLSGSAETLHAVDLHAMSAGRDNL